MIKQFIQSKKCTLLCSGPMSTNCIDSAIEISQEYKVPQVLIASRRQVDAKEFGGGYVENYSTQDYTQYLKNKKNSKIFLARDHGGPWQGEYEKINNLNVEQSMQIAKKSFEIDILSGFDFIHIDPSISIQNETLSLDTILKRLFELYGHTYEFAKMHDKNISFELGTEEQNGHTESIEQFEYFLNKVAIFCDTQKIKKPTFIVAQTGTKVMETENVGEFSKNKNPIATIKNIQHTLNLCNKYDVMLKEHNTDYLSNESLALRPIIGIHASNIAPEFGVVETKGFLYLLNTFGYKKEFDVFVDKAIASKKWEKWMLQNTQATEIDKAMICGHYIFADEQIKQMKQKVAKELLKQNVDLDEYLKTLVKQSMLRYMQLFKMI
ncbi:MAG TPA: hypothetical protein CFH84_11555 [Sulfurimonas sp. UBA12504]|nr:MAG TPA: hypothetical protein CFH84_11555 [Sulfurimonas sp. UBA12504]